MDNNPNPPTEDSQNILFEKPTYIDPLTGLFNQYYLYQFLPEEIEKSKLGAYSVAVFMLDFDGFKDVNDTYGHLSGDAVLKQLASIIKKTVRASDMVIRYAGDEFTIILPAADKDRAKVVATKLVENVNAYEFKVQDGSVIHLSISLGFSVCPDDSVEIAKLIDLADKALYSSKKRGKNRATYTREVSLDTVSQAIAMDSFPCKTFIGRLVELNSLKHIFDVAVIESNLLQLVLVTGDSGVGKTRLMNEVNGYFQGKTITIQAHASESRSNDPYHLFVKGITAYIDSISNDSGSIQNLFSSIKEEELFVLGQIIPSIANLFKKSVDLQIDEKMQRILLFKGFLDLLGELSKNTALVICFDDINWADKASFELIRYLTRQEKNKKIFILCSYVSGPGAQSLEQEDFKEFYDEVKHNDNFTEITVPNFNFEDVSLMIRTIFPGLVMQRESFEMVYEATKGNPSFIEEILKSMVENGVISYREDHWEVKKDLASGDIPLSLSEVVRNRLKNLDKETKEMIVQAAVIGDGFSVDMLKKINNKDEGFMLELLQRAKKMRLVEELDSRKNFGFMNKNVADMLYKELTDEQRNNLHYKIGQMLTEEHKDNLRDVAGELAFHFSKAPQQDKTGEFSSKLLEKTGEIYRPYEILDYLDKLAKEVIAKEEKEVVPLTEKMFKEAIKFVRAFQGTIKVFHLYPPGIVRINTVKESYAILNCIWQENPTLSLGEIERALVINSRRLSSKESEEANTEYFLKLIMDLNIKVIDFNKEMEPEDFGKLIEYMMCSYADITDKGGWNELVSREAIKGIKINELRLVRMTGAGTESHEKKKIEDMMLMEFLLGKIQHGNVDKNMIVTSMGKEPKKFAQAIMTAAQEEMRGAKSVDEAQAVVNSIEKINSQILDKKEPDGSVAGNLAKVILELKPQLRNKVIRTQLLNKESQNKEMAEDIIKAAPNEVIVDIILDDYKENKENLLAVKACVDNLLVKHPGKENILKILETELLKASASPEEVSFIKGEKLWSELPLEKKVADIVKLPSKYFQSEIERTKELISEMTSNHKDKELEYLIYNLVVKSSDLELSSGKELLKILADFIKKPFSDEAIEALDVENKLGGLLERLKIETDPKVLKSVLDLFKDIINDFAAQLQLVKNISLISDTPLFKKYSSLILNVMSGVQHRYVSAKGQNAPVLEVVRSFTRDISKDEFLKILICILVNNPYQQDFSVGYLFDIIGDKIIDMLMNILTEANISSNDSFRDYVIKKRITDLLKDLGAPAIEKLKIVLGNTKNDDLDPVFLELAGSFKKEELVVFIAPFTTHKNSLIRYTAVESLGRIACKKSLEIIQALLKNEKDKNIVTFAKEQLKLLQSQGIN